MGIPYRFGPIYATPEMTLLIVNLYAWVVNPKMRVMLSVVTRKELVPSIWEVVLVLNEKSKNPNKHRFLAGQYAEWMVPHNKPDSRGTRRFITIASSPTEQELRIVLKLPDHPSSWKRALVKSEPPPMVMMAGLSGEFVLPQDEQTPVAFLAGGIGITPLLSMIKHMMDTKQNRDVVLVYACSSGSEFISEKMFQEAKRFGVRTEYVITREEGAPPGWKGNTGRVTPSMLTHLIPDFTKRTWYLSGPSAMVDGYENHLEEMGISRGSIKKDYFPGFYWC